jgi:hypothetical protein
VSTGCGEDAFLEAEVGFLEAEVGFLEAKAGFLEAEAGFLEAEAGFLDAEADFLEAEAGFLDALGEGVTVDATTGALWLVAEIASGDGVATGAALLRGDAARDFADGVF